MQHMQEGELMTTVTTARKCGNCDTCSCKNKGENNEKTQS